MWVNYFGVQNQGTGFAVTTAGNAFARGIVRDSDFGVQGPYVGLKWIGNVA